MQILCRRAVKIPTAVEPIITPEASCGQKHVVTIVDQALFPQLMPLKWSVSEYRNVLSPILRGLHIILKLLESNWSAYATCWIKCDVDRRQSIRGKYYRTCNDRKGLRKGNVDTCSQNHYSGNVTTASATTN